MQPSAVAVLPSIRILSVVGVHLFQTERQRAFEMLLGVIVAQMQGLAVRFAQRLLAREFFVQQRFDHVHVDIERRHQRAGVGDVLHQNARARIL